MNICALKIELTPHSSCSKNRRQTRHFLALTPDKANSMLDDAMRRHIALIVPHARRALLIGKAMELKQSEAATFADTLNGLSAGMFLVDENGTDRPCQCLRP